MGNCLKKDQAYYKLDSILHKVCFPEACQNNDYPPIFKGSTNEETSTRSSVVRCMVSSIKIPENAFQFLMIIYYNNFFLFCLFFV